ncbi:uncharacterized protein KD926_009116 [Aspergillus affinis]|uniref:uncharacterized protein n=1 Tax=Aspergillus affinis TaxID=1070780 RepID=UPI0022FE6A79|nr:uncharacterized protein KD926_009116 [Aspergillus affinis]KAI9039773.1 hypothetical protein KD926_009116 [Aspergillus affinis]
MEQKPLIIPIAAKGPVSVRAAPRVTIRGVRTRRDAGDEGHAGAKGAGHGATFLGDEVAAVDGRVVAAGRALAVLRLVAVCVVEHAAAVVDGAGGDAVGEVDGFNAAFGEGLGVFCVRHGGCGWAAVLARARVRRESSTNHTPALRIPLASYADADS